MRIAAARPVRPHLRTRSGRRAASGRASGWLARPSAVRDPDSISGARDRRPVALEPVDLGDGPRVQIVRQRRVLELLGDGLPVALGVLQPRLDALGGALVLAGLAGV